jgi:hypothetical protein
MWSLSAQYAIDVGEFSKLNEDVGCVWVSPAAYLCHAAVTTAPLFLAILVTSPHATHRRGIKIQHVKQIEK